MGAAAAHVLDLASSGAGAAGGAARSVHDIDLGRLRERLRANLDTPGDDGRSG
jgi:hypothetical protein